MTQRWLFLSADVRGHEPKPNTYSYGKQVDIGDCSFVRDELVDAILFPKDDVAIVVDGAERDLHRQDDEGPVFVMMTLSQRNRALEMFG